MNDLLRFWKWLKDNFDLEVLEEYMEGYDFSVEDLNDNSLSEKEDDEIESIFGDLISLFMDVSGNDNYGDVYQILKDEIKLDDSKIDELLS